MNLSKSVALCTFNGEKYLREQIDSILSQTLPVDEIIVCDDGSTDKTVSILEEYASKNPGLFSIYINEKNLRSTKNFQKALSLCTKDIIFLSDQDDLWAKDKVEKLSAYLVSNPEYNVVSTNGCGLYDHKKIDCDSTSVWDIPNLLEEENNPYQYFEIISSITNIATGATMVIRKSFLNNACPFPEYQDFHHDEWLALVASYQNSFSFFNEKLTYYRIHEEQQVGANFFKLSKKNLLAITSIYRKASFKEYKRCLKVISANYNKKIAIKSSNTLREEFTTIIDASISQDFNAIKKLNKKMYSEHKLTYIFLKISDFFSGKRKIKKAS